jgi:hypothetical protein
VIAWLAAAALAGASPCGQRGGDDDGAPEPPRGSGLADGPVAASLWDGALGRAQGACPRRELAVAPHAYLLADTPAFYGVIAASGVIEGSALLDRRTELSARLELVRYQDVISAISSSYLGLGYTTVGATRRVDDGGSGPALAVVGQLVLPSAFGLSAHAAPFAVDVGLAGLARRGPWEGHAQAGLAGSAAISHGPTQARLGVPLTAGGAWRPGSAFATVLDLQASVGYTAALDHLALAPALRFGAGNWGLELGATVPVLGRERALLAGELRTGLRL